METKHHNNRELEQLLANSVEQEPPPWLRLRIMTEITDRRPSFSDRLRRWWLRPQSVSFSPAWLVSTVAVAVCAFWLGTLAEQHGQPGPPGPAGQTDSTLPAVAANAEANYLIGRGLLAAGQIDQALAFLRQAVQQEPEVAEFAHWQGVAYWAVGESSEERQSYLRSMEKQPDYLPTLLNLGHNYLESGEYRQALSQYEKVLEVDPLESSALYNRALAYYMLKDTGRAEQAFIGYLEQYRTGKWALRAIRHLHQLGNLTFRSYRIGTDQVVLNMAALLGQDAATRGRELMHLAKPLSRVAGDELHLVVYNQGSRNAAKATATALQAQLLQYLGDEHGVPVRVSWFDAAETFTDGSGTDRQLPTSLLIFTRPMEQSNRRNSI